MEIHGSVHWGQCLADCGAGLFPADFAVEVDEGTMRARDPLAGLPDVREPGPAEASSCSTTGAGTQPGLRAGAAACNKWLADVSGMRVAVVECGAGLAIPTVRRLCEQVARTHRGTLIRLNPREPEVPGGQIGLPLGALDGLRPDRRADGRSGGG